MKQHPAAAAASYALLAVLAFVMLFPLLYAISGSLMTAREISTYPPAFLPSQPRLNNFADVLNALPIPRQYLNSLIVAACVMVGQLATSILSAYAFAFLRMPLRNLIFAIFLATMMVPWEAIIIPNYLTMAQYHLINSYPALILPFLAAGFGTFLLRQFFLSFPKDLYDSALLDGAGHLRFLWSILLPISRPALAALAIWSFLSAWNQFLWPLLVINRDEMQTLQIGISRLQDVEAGTAPNFILAGTVLALVPTLLLIYFGQRHIVRGLTAGALRG
ncbi:MAG TPA: carbohydrate ABC transporter permease [Candidatus Dormibacteraeota bacterium]|jgi:sn-glycerol 3-phosphate transport system permease protein